ncbi:hypothetical protein [Akkermansia sp.]|uniref:hypothetical protein n=1 Tax=Akkermansia sp. TaxID=1872421 RepID=UPI0025C401A1|nr:hypothetical protein [Akkermansia sp.]MCD8065275.1 hypothetical protein [Akkermansia sp.]
MPHHWINHGIEGRLIQTAFLDDVTPPVNTLANRAQNQMGQERKLSFLSRCPDIFEEYQRKGFCIHDASLNTNPHESVNMEPNHLLVIPMLILPV